MSEVTAALIADLAGTSRQAIEKALKHIATGKTTTWRGAALIIRIAPSVGRGGWCYMVDVDSLPPDLQMELRRREAAELDPSILRIDTAAGDWTDFWTATLAPALAHPKRSAERAAAVRAIAGRLHFTPAGEQAEFSARHVTRLIRAFENRGIAGLRKIARRDRGRRRYVISKLWDETVPFDLETRITVADDMRHLVRRLWASGYPLSRVLQTASEALLKATREAGHDAPYRELRHLCRLPRAFAEREKVARKVHRFLTDRKAHEDAKPRIRRTIDGMAPMQLVAGDVHHLDVLMVRPDGSTATPKMVAWLDIGTGRIFYTVFLLDAGRGITNAHVIASFIAMVMEWGLPQMLYLDNGSEYNWADFIGDALKLVGNGLREIVDRNSPVVRAMPYNAPAKFIEGTFRVLEQLHFATVPGYIGGNRMATKTANVGRAPKPFPGDLDAFRQVAEGIRTIYNATPQSGLLKGRAPNEILAEAVAQGWSRIDCDPDALTVAFSTEEPRHVRQGSIEAGGRRWTCPELHSYLHDRVTVLVPKFEGWARLPLKDAHGQWLGYAEPEVAYHPLDIEGARESARRGRRYNDAVRELRRASPPVDTIRQTLETAAALPPPPVVPIGGRVTLGDGFAEIGKAIRETPEDRRRRRQAEINRDQAERLALIEKRKRAMGEI